MHRAGARAAAALKAAGSTVDAARERVWQSAAAYLPQVSANYARTAQGHVRQPHGRRRLVRRPPSRGRSTSTRPASRSRRCCSTSGRTWRSSTARRALESSRAADAQTEHDAIVFEVSQAYLGLLAAQRLLVVADETVRQNKQHLDLAQGRYDVGFAPRFDVTQASVQLASAELAQVTARKNVTLGRETLRNAMGMSGPLDFDVVDVLAQPP
jgi:outer membrane protein TolC